MVEKSVSSVRVTLSKTVALTVCTAWKATPKEPFPRCFPLRKQCFVAKDEDIFVATVDESSMLFPCAVSVIRGC